MPQEYSQPGPVNDQSVRALNLFARVVRREPEREHTQELQNLVVVAPCGLRLKLQRSSHVPELSIIDVMRIVGAVDHNRIPFNVLEKEAVTKGS